MKNLIIIASLFISNMAMSQNSELTTFILNTGTSIHSCKVFAHVTEKDAVRGHVESIKGAVISLKISTNLDYTLIIDDEIYEINKEEILAFKEEKEAADLLASK